MDFSDCSWVKFTDQMKDLMSLQPVLRAHVNGFFKWVSKGRKKTFQSAPRLPNETLTEALQ